MHALLVVDCIDEMLQRCLGFEEGPVAVAVDFFELHGPKEAFHVGIVARFSGSGEAGFAACVADEPHVSGSGVGRALVGVVNPAEVRFAGLQSLQEAITHQGFVVSAREVPGHRFARIQVHEGGQVERPRVGAHPRGVGDPDLVGGRGAEALEQVACPAIPIIGTTFPLPDQVPKPGPRMK